MYQIDYGLMYSCKGLNTVTDSIYKGKKMRLLSDCQF